MFGEWDYSSKPAYNERETEANIRRKEADKLVKELVLEAESYRSIESRKKFEDFTELYDRTIKAHEKYVTFELRELAQQLLKRMFRYCEERK